jgi:oligopeptide transport system ATP-binding protein
LTEESRNAIEVLGLTKQYHGRRGSTPAHALAGVDLSVAHGRCLAVVGESGSGKTTLARIIVGLEQATAGSVQVAGRWVGQRVNRAERRRRARDVQMVFQDPNGSLNRRRSVGSAIEEVLRLHHGMSRTESRSEVGRLLESVGLEARHGSVRPLELSGGQRQRVAIARALAARPSIIILDEAVAALDVSVQSQVLNLLSDLRTESGLTYLFITHDLAVVRQVADDVLVMQHGAVVERGTVAQILDSPKSPYTRLLLESVPRPDWRPVRRRLDEARL